MHDSWPGLAITQYRSARRDPDSDSFKSPDRQLENRLHGVNPGLF
jgi:hypothetical protein